MTSQQAVVNIVSNEREAQERAVTNQRKAKKVKKVLGAGFRTKLFLREE